MSHSCYRFENQTEINKQLGLQVEVLSSLVTEEKEKIKRLQKGLDIDLDKLTETEVKKMMTSLAREKYNLESMFSLNVSFIDIHKGYMNIYREIS